MQTVISRGYSSKQKPGDKPYYPVNKERNVIFGGRLGEYKYYDMDVTIAEALKMSKENI